MLPAQSKAFAPIPLSKPDPRSSVAPSAVAARFFSSLPRSPPSLPRSGFEPEMTQP